MFAVSTQSKICHLMEPNGRLTVYGLKVSKLVSSDRAGPRLHLVPTRPAECGMCKHCVRLNESEARIQTNKLLASHEALSFEHSEELRRAQ